MDEAGPQDPSGWSSYRLLEQVGSCYQADLFLAEWAGAFSRAKGISLLRVRPDLLVDPEARAMLLEDLRRAAALSFFSIASIVDLWEGESGVAVATEAVGGTTLAEAARAAGRAGGASVLALETVVVALLDVCRALTFAHETVPGRGPVVHGDLRPEWILLGHDGTVKLTGFGFGRFLSRVSPDGSFCVWDGRCYQAPERLRSQALDPRSDVFSLGVILLEVATGTIPYGTDEPAWLLTLLESGTSPIPPGGREVSLDLAKVIRKACAVDPADRYPSTEALGADLHALLTARQVAPSTDVIRGALEALALSPLWRDEGGTAALALPGSQEVRVLGGDVLPRLLGRREAVDLIGEALAKADSGAGGAILLTGEPGMGRSRLLGEVERRVQALGPDRTVAWLPVSSHPAERTVGASGVLRLLAAAIGLDAGCDLVEVAEEADRLRAFGIDTETIAAIRGLLGLGERPEPARLSSLLTLAAVQCLSSLSWERTTVIAWDDVDLSDEASLAALVDLAGRLRSLRVLALLTARPAFEVGLEEAGVDRIVLGPLGRSECEALALGLVPDAIEVEARVLDELRELSGGSPLLLAELLRLLLGCRRLAIDEEGRLARTETGAALPGLEEALAERLAAMSGEDRAAAVAAAVAGPALCDRVVAAAARITVDQAGEALVRLATSEGLLRRGPAGLEFAHERIAQAALASASAFSLRLMQERAARAILEVWSDPAEGMDAHAATLLAAASDPGAAAAVLLDGARRLELRGDVRGAAERYRRGLALARRSGTVTPEGELFLSLAEGRVTLAAFDLDEAERALGRAVELADGLRDAAAGTEARVTLSRVLTRQGRFAEAMSRAREALPLAESTGDRLALADVHAAMGESAQHQGLYGQDIEHVDLAMTIASEEGDPTRLGAILNLAVLHAAGVGAYDRTRDLLARAHEVAAAIGSPALSCELARAEGLLLIYTGELEASLEVNLAGVERARELGLTELEVTMLHNCGDAHLRLGHPREAHYYFSESRRLARASHVDRLTEANEMFLGYLEASWLGLDEGMTRLTSAIERARRLGRAWNLAQGQTLLGAALLARGSRDRAVEALERALELASGTGVHFFVEEARALLEDAKAGA